MAKQEKKRKGRKSYLNDFVPNLAGEYTFTGIHYRYKGDDAAFRRARNAVAVGALAVLAGFLLPGFVSVGGMGNSFYVLIPYMGEAISVFVTLIAVYKMLMAGNRIREYIFQKSVERLPGACVCCSAFAAVGFICSMIFSAINGIGGSIPEAAVLIIGKTLGIIAPLELRKHIRSLEWVKE